jgi:hypothetical protein
MGVEAGRFHQIFSTHPMIDKSIAADNDLEGRIGCVSLGEIFACYHLHPNGLRL